MKKIVGLALSMAGLISASCAAAAGGLDDLKGGASAGTQLSKTMEFLERARVARQIEEDKKRENPRIQDNRVGMADDNGKHFSFVLKKVDFNESLVLQNDVIRDIIGKYTDRAADIEDLYKIVKEINELYARGGFITCKAFLPPQKVKDGEVKILLVEGQTGKVTVSGNKNTRSEFISRRISLPGGKIVNINDLNKQIMLFNGTNDVQLRIAMQAGEGPGTTDFVINAYEPQRFVSTIFADNAGNYTSGTYRLGYFLTARSLSGNRDNLTTGIIASEGTTSYSAVYSFPAGTKGTMMSLGYSGNNIKIVRGEMDDAGLDVKGHSAAYTASLRHPLIVNAKARGETGLEFNHQSSKTSISGTPWVDDMIRDFAPYYSHTDYGNTHVFYQKHSYVAIGNSQNIANEERNFYLYKFNSYYQKAYRHGQMFTGRVDVQFEGTNYLPSSRQFYIGGMNSVRGYRESYLSGDRGLSASLEYQLPFTKDKKHNAFCFYDYGDVGGKSAFDDHVLQSVGIGVKDNWTKHVYSSLCVAFPLKKDLNDNTVSKTRIHFLLNGTF